MVVSKREYYIGKCRVVETWKNGRVTSQSHYPPDCAEDGLKWSEDNPDCKECSQLVARYGCRKKKLRYLREHGLLPTAEEYNDARLR